MNLDIWQLLGGIGLFLFAMTQVETSLKALGERSFTNLLRRGSEKPLQSVLGGVAATAMLQSSSIVGLMVLAFVGAGIMPLRNALGVVIGSNLGTTFTGWIVATVGFKFDVEDLALPMIAVGAVAMISFKTKTSRWGQLIVGAGLLFLGLSLMKESVAALQSSVDLQQLADFSSWQYLIFGALFAAVIQSSSATMMINLTALFSGIIELPAAAAIAIGADFGTTSTVLLGAVNGAAAKKRVALAHFLFNLITDIIAFLLLVPLLGVVAMTGLEDPLLTLVAFHSLFNLLGIAIFFPLLKPFAAFLERRFHHEVEPVGRFIAGVSASAGGATLPAIEQETAHLIARVVQQNLGVFKPAVQVAPGRLPLPVESTLEAAGFKARYERTKELEGEILAFASRVQSQALEEDDLARLNQLREAVRAAVHSSKILKDVRHDLETLKAGHQERLQIYEEWFRQMTVAFNRHLFGLQPHETDTVSFEALVDVLQAVHEDHDKIHNEIYEDVHRGRIRAGEISTLLNVNRGMLNASIALVAALAEYHLDAGQADALEKLPGSS
jgi:phosphate:Na+ symporter